MAKFAIVGAGWRTEFFLRVVQELPDEFELTSMLVRSDERAEQMKARWGIRTCRTLDELAADRPEFVITSVDWGSNPGFIRELSERKLPVLSETPPAPNHEALLGLVDLIKAGARVQVAEQYFLQPEHAARLAVIRSGKLGSVFQAQVSVCHGYHGISLIRRFLGIDYQAPLIWARRVDETVVGGPDRDGRPPKEEKTQNGKQLIAHLDFGDKQAIFDFTGTQYHTWLRSPRVLIRGDRGEINTQDVRYLIDFKTPLHNRLQRVDTGHTGNLEGRYLRGITLGDQWVYENPFPFARLNDDEVAVAAMMRGMAAYAAGGPDIYPLAEACQDHYLSMLMERSADTGQPVQAEVQPWASSNS
jgi:predicted dehydrogenase